MAKLMLALIFLCPAVTFANVTCPDGSFCPDGNTCCSMTEGGYGCCPMPNAVCCSNDKCCPQGDICLTTLGVCIHAETAHSNFGVSPMMSKTPSMQNPLVKDTPCPEGGSCPDNQTCCSGGCCPYPNARCCSDGEHCCPSGYKCDLATQQCVSGNGNRIPLYTKTNTLDKTSIKSQVVGNAKRVTENVVYCPGGQYYCPDRNTCCPSYSGQWTCCPYPSASCCPDLVHCCPAGYRCSPTSQQCLNGFFYEPMREKTLANRIP